MNKTSLLFALILSWLSCDVVAQEGIGTPDPTYSDGIRHKEIVMNLTPFAAQFVPFNASTLSKFNIFDFEIRRIKNNKGTRFGLGINISADFNPTEPQSLYLRYGFIKRRQVAQRFHFFRSWDFNILAEDTDINGRNIGKIGFSGLAIAYSAGLQYNLNDRIALSTEGILFLGILNADNGNPQIRFIPPVGLFLHVKL